MPDERRRVLVVDDEPVIADTLSLILSEAGYDSSPAYTGKDAIEIARVFRPHFVISDIVMPGTSGIGVAIQIRTFLPQCRILLLTGQSVTPEMISSSQAEGLPFEILAKPLNPEELLARLKT